MFVCCLSFQFVLRQAFAGCRFLPESIALRLAGHSRRSASRVLWQTRLRSNRQPAAAPGRRAAPLRRRPIRSAAGWSGVKIGPLGAAALGGRLHPRAARAGPSARQRAGPGLGSVRQDRAGRSFAPRRPAARVCKSARACASQAAARVDLSHFIDRVSVSDGGSQPLVGVEAFCCELDCEAIGSPQPLPGGGLLLCVAGSSARLWAGPELRPVRQDRVVRSFRLAEACRPYPNLRATARLRDSPAPIPTSCFARSRRWRRACASSASR